MKESRKFSTQEKLFSGTMGLQVGYVSALTYPMFAPYRNNENKIYGRLPRLIAVVMATLIHVGDPCWDPMNRRIYLGRGWRQLCRCLGIFNSALSRRDVYTALENMRNEDIPGFIPVRAIDETHFDEKKTNDMYVMLSREYCDQVRKEVHEISIAGLYNLKPSVILVDLMALAALYAPENRRLVIPSTTLRKIFPDVYLQEGKLCKNLKKLNGAQNVWRFEIMGDSIVVMPSDMQMKKWSNNPLFLDTFGIVD